MAEQPETEPLTRVIFRRYRDGSIVALFPEIPADHTGRYCTCYVHVGQHSAADYTGVIDQTRPATVKEYDALRRELEQIGYRLQIRRRRR